MSLAQSFVNDNYKRMLKYTYKYSRGPIPYITTFFLITWKLFNGNYKTMLKYTYKYSRGSIYYYIFLITWKLLSGTHRGVTFVSES